MNSSIENEYSNKLKRIRALRKKLRQIEKLERVEGELSYEEQIKIDSKEDIRDELQDLVKLQEDNVVSLTPTETEPNEVEAEDRTENEEKGNVFTDEKSDVNKLTAMNAFDTSSMNGHHLGFASTGSHIPQVNGHHFMGSQFSGHSVNYNGHSMNSNGHMLNSNGHTMNSHFGGHLDTHALNGHTMDGHHVTSLHQFPMGGGLSLGFSDDGEIIADLEEVDDKSGSRKTTLPESLLFGEENESGKNTMKKNNYNTSKAQNNRKIEPLLVFQGATFKMQQFEGHHHDTCAIDICGDYVISGGRDTCLKLWFAPTLKEVKSLGGHDGTITGVKFLKDKPFTSYPKAVTSSYDCSLRIWNLQKGDVERSIYVYSPVCSLDYSHGLACIGTEGGKVEIYNLENGSQEYSVQGHSDEVTAVKFLPDGKIASGSIDGILKIHDPKDKNKNNTYFNLKDSKLAIRQAVESEVDISQMKTMSIIHTRITCIEAYKDLVVYGDEGFNVKVLDIQKGEIIKIRNNLKEYSPTEALYISTVQGRDFLFCVGSDVDSGDCFTNVRSLPDLRYMGTIRDPNVNSGKISGFCIEEKNSKIRFITCGSQLRTWDQIDPPKRAKKRKSSSDEEEPYVPCKFICTFTVPRESEPESDDEENETTSHNSSVSAESIKTSNISTAGEESKCTIL